MNFRRIESRENPLMKEIGKLQNSAKHRRETGCFVLEGLRACLDAAENGISFRLLVVSDSFLSRSSDSVGRLAALTGDRVAMKEELFEKISDTKTPQGVLAIGEIPAQNPDEIDPSGRYIALENLQDPGNFGTVLRTAEALGLDGVILSQNGCDPFSPKVLRASMGTALRVKIFSFFDFAGQLQKTGLRLFACVVDSAAIPISQVRFEDGCCCLIGNEANGLKAETAAVCTPITIPMRGRAESLNAAVAASIAMWEMSK